MAPSSTTTHTQTASGPESSRSPVTSPTERSFNKKRSSYQSDPRKPSSTTSASYENGNNNEEYYEEDDVDLRRSSSSSNSTRGRRSHQRDIPISPPSVGSDDDYYQNDEVRETRAENVLGNWHYAPLLIAIVPPLGALLGGGADAWSDAILLIIASFYLYQLLKGELINHTATYLHCMLTRIFTYDQSVPHDIYHTVRLPLNSSMIACKAHYFLCICRRVLDGFSTAMPMLMQW